MPFIVNARCDYSDYAYIAFHNGEEMRFNLEKRIRQYQILQNSCKRKQIQFEAKRVYWDNGPSIGYCELYNFGEFERIVPQSDKNIKGIKMLTEEQQEILLKGNEHQLLKEKSKGYRLKEAYIQDGNIYGVTENALRFVYSKRVAQYEYQ